MAVMKAAALCSLFSSNRKHLRKSVKLFLNLLEDSRGTFPWNICNDYESDGKEYVQGTFHVEHCMPSTHLKRTFQSSRCRSCKLVALGVSSGRFNQAGDSNGRWGVMRACCKCEFVAIGGEGVEWWTVSGYLSGNPPLQKMRKWRTCLTRYVNLLRVGHEQSG
jgi:hypothetical protein